MEFDELVIIQELSEAAVSGMKNSPKWKQLEALKNEDHETTRKVLERILCSATFRTQSLLESEFSRILSNVKESRKEIPKQEQK